MKKKEVRAIARRFAKKMLLGAEGGHDWLHIDRVIRNAKKIMKKEKADKHVVILGILLHDIADPKFNEGDASKGIKISEAFLNETGIKKRTKEQVMEIVREISFKGGFEEAKKKSMELQVAQDADRLDALGAIGIARAFNYGGYKGRKLYDPSELPREYKNIFEYRNNVSSTINHFHEKLLKLEAMMNTGTAKKLAKKRHEFLIKFLEQFEKEVEGKA